ncbi:type IV pilus biogenesis/stability protein PilW [Pseudidiomarina sediminum]|uniref:Type IV pilus biogenesis/stability protein PilW n=1 Tax=Pseudidiomarina sediminum TaxID=431675 RepID=A0A432Z9P0_9GAMM|nr:type IV pilus biogenesis/stability protein PilW [Pseudidiomarina sediminum]RUO74591.1 type IV pilus biogenesis/stability protein PilW [Pseudidiomarina sediminum]
MRFLITALGVGMSLLLLTGCVSQRTIDGKETPAPEFNAEEAAATRLALGLQYLQLGNFEQARVNLERARDYTPNNPSVQTGMALYYQQVKDFPSAERYYRKAIAGQPNNGDTHNNLGVLLCSLGRYQEADASFNTALSLPDYIKVAATYENAARCAAQAGDFEKSDGYFRRAINHSSRNSTILESYAAVLLEQQRYQEAQRILERRSQLPQLSPQYLWLETELARQLKDRAKQQTFGELLISRFPDSRQAHDYRARKAAPNS